jgi:hypothetical protein
MPLLFFGSSPSTTSPVILTDSIFNTYGGETGTSSVTLRNAAYSIAENQMVEHLNAYLQPTIVTGTYFWPPADPLELDNGYVEQILGLTLYSANEQFHVYTISEISKYVLIRNARCGYIDILRCPLGWIHPHTLSIVTQSGLSSIITSQSTFLLALTMAAQIILNELVNDFTLVNEGVGDIGIQEFSNQFYHEIRTKLGHSAFGSSAKANMIARLVKGLRARSALRFH